jgi:hypothetical protein
VLVLMVSPLEPRGVTCARFADEMSVWHLDCGISDCFGSGVAVLWMRATALTSAAMALLSRDSMFACVCLANCLLQLRLSVLLALPRRCPRLHAYD